MPLLVYNLTGTAVMTARGTPPRLIPASSAPPAPGEPVNMTTELQGLSGPAYADLEAQRTGNVLAFEWTSDAEYSTTGLTVAGPTIGLHANTHKTAGGTDVLTIATSAAANVGATTATMVQETKAANVRYRAPRGVGTTALKGLTNIAASGSLMPLTLQPDYPRKLQVAIVDANDSISAGTLTITGVGASGEAVTEVIPFKAAAGANSRTVTTTYAYATISAVDMAGVVGFDAGVDQVSIGDAAALGLPVQQIPTAGNFSVYKANVAMANEAIGTVDATARTISPTTPPNGTNIYDFFYTYTVTAVQNSHLHTQVQHTHNIT